MDGRAFNEPTSGTDPAEGARNLAEWLGISVIYCWPVHPGDAVYSPPDDPDDVPVLVIRPDQTPEGEATAILRGIQRYHFRHADN